MEPDTAQLKSGSFWKEADPQRPAVQAQCSGSRLQVPAWHNLGSLLLFCYLCSAAPGCKLPPSGNFLAERKSCRADVGSGKVHVKDCGGDVV